MAAGAVAQPVSTIGKAPALPSTSIKSAAELSATTTIGPKGAMGQTACVGRASHLTQWLVTPRQRSACERCERGEVALSLRLRHAPPGLGQIAVERSRVRAADDGPARDPLR